MRLSERFERKVIEAIEELPLLDIERKQIDYEIIPAVVPVQNGELITTFVIALFMPSGPNEYVSHMAQADNPYATQEVVNKLVRDLVQLVQDERRANLNVGPPGMSPGGLVLP